MGAGRHRRADTDALAGVLRARSGVGLAGVHPDHGLLLVGGSDSEAENGRVWRWTGTAWQRLGEDVMPPRQAFGLAYDERRDVVVLTGGVVEPGSVERHQDVWEWVGDPGVPAVPALADE